MNITDQNRALVALRDLYNKPYTLAFCHAETDWWMKDELKEKNAVFIEPTDRPSTVSMTAEEFVYDVLYSIRGTPVKDAYFAVCTKNVYTAELLVALWKKMRKGGRIVIAHPDPDSVWPDRDPANAVLPDVPMQRPASFNNAMHAFWAHTGIPVYRPQELVHGRTVFIMTK